MSTALTNPKYCPVCSRRFEAAEPLTRCTADGAELVAATFDELIGQTIDGKYLLLEVIGTGGFSTVYRAKQVGLERFVAFKLMRADLVSTVERIKRFEQEAHLASNLNHPNICAVYDCGILDTGQPYLVLENVEGRNLDHILQSGRVLPQGRALGLIKQLATGLQAAHDQGILHRDLKPGNVMVVDTENGELVKIIDFGLAKLFGMQNVEQLSITGETMGTPAYMSPEQVQGKTLDARSDVYALGCIIFEILCGKKPIDGKNAFETMLNHLHTEPSPMSSGDYVVPFALRELTLKCLRKDPAERYTSANEVKQEIEKIESSDSLTAPERGIHWRLRSPKRKMLMSGAAAVVVASLLAYGISSMKSPTPATHAVEAVKYDPAIVHLMEEFDELMSSFQFVAAETVGKRAFDTLQSSGRQFSPEMLMVSKKLRTYHLDGGRRTKAVEYIKAWLAAKEHLTKPGSEELIEAHRQAAHDFEKAVDEQDALGQFNEIVNLTAQKYGATSPEYDDALFELASGELRADNFKHAQVLFEQLTNLKDSKYSPKGLRGLSALNALCNAYIGLGKTEDAQRVSNLAVGSISAATPAADRLDALRTAAHAAERRRDLKSANILIDQAIEATKLVPDGRGATYVTSELQMVKGSYLRQAGDYASAEAVLRKALKEILNTHQPESNEYRFGLNEYVKVLRATSRQKEADAIELKGRY